MRNRIFLTVLLLICAFQSPLTNKDVADLASSGVSAEIIVAKIKASPCDFDTSTETIKKLKTEGLADSVIVAMIECAKPKEPDTVTVPDGTSFIAVFQEMLSGNAMASGDAIVLKVEEDVMVNNVAVIKKGAVVKGLISDAAPRGQRGQPGRLAVELRHVIAVDGQRIRIHANVSSTGRDARGHTIAREARGDPFAWVVRGGKATIPAGRRVVVETDEEKKVKIPSPTPAQP